MKNISLVVAMSENGVIGHDNKLLWHLPNDLKHFKSMTLGKPIIMGRKTYESIGRPLPDRQNIILTHQKDFKAPGCEVVHTVDEALKLTVDAKEAMVIGGGEIYRLFLDKANRIYQTVVHAKVQGEITFAEIDHNMWEETAHEEYFQDEKHAYDYSFVTLERRE